MNASEAADTYRALAPRLQEDVKTLEQAKRVLKEYFLAHPEKRAFKRVGCKFGTQSRFDQARAKELLGQRAADCVTEVTTASLFLL